MVTLAAIFAFLGLGTLVYFVVRDVYLIRSGQKTVSMQAWITQVRHPSIYSVGTGLMLLLGYLVSPLGFWGLEVLVGYVWCHMFGGWTEQESEGS